MTSPEIYNFGPYRLDVDGRQLFRLADDRAAWIEVSIRPQALSLLIHLIRNRSRAVPKEEAWHEMPKRATKRTTTGVRKPRELIFDVNTVDRALVDVRLALGGAEESARYINTPSPGTLRFIGIVTVDAPSVARRSAPSRLDSLNFVAPLKQQQVRIPEQPGTSSSTDWHVDRIDLGGVDLELIRIPSGSFLMGSDEYDGFEAERPQHAVSLASFWIGQYPVTQTQWRSVMGTDPSHTHGDYLPVERVSWNHAVRFCELLSSQTGHVFRLPTEAEWEYACRAGSTGRFSFYGDETELADYAWFKVNAQGQTHEVGQKLANAWGVFDMHGNVWEWCSDWYSSDYYATSESVNPQGPADGATRVMRGGAFSSNYMNCRSAVRNYNSPDVRLRNVGVRVVRSA